MIAKSNNNGKSVLIMWLIGALFTVIVVIAMPTMAKGIIENRETNIKEHNEIRKDISNGDEKVMEKVDCMKDLITEILATQSAQGEVLNFIKERIKELK